MSFAMAMACCSFCAGITLSTGPKISSCAMAEELSTLPKTVGSMNQPRSRSSASPARGQRGARRDPLGDAALDTIALAFGDEGSHLRLRVEWIAHSYLREGSGERLEERIVAALADDDPRQGGADLTGEEALGAGQLAAAGQVHVVEDDRGDFPPSSGCSGRSARRTRRRCGGRRPSTR